MQPLSKTNPDIHLLDNRCNLPLDTLCKRKLLALLFFPLPTRLTTNFLTRSLPHRSWYAEGIYWYLNDRKVDL